MRHATVNYTNGFDVAGSVVVPTALLTDHEGIYRAVCDDAGIFPAPGQSACEAIAGAGICKFKATIKENAPS